MVQSPLTLRRWKRLEYDRLVDLGVFEGEPLELIGGQLVVAEPHGTYHASAISAVDYAVRAILPPGWIVRIQLPVSLDDESEPEPDLVVVPGNRAFLAQLRDVGVRVADPREHLVGVLAQARRRTLDARTAVGELERGQRHGHRALDPLDRVVLVEHPASLELGIGQRLGEPSHAAGRDVA